jgi:DNA-binding SARP family transcriptional activator
LERAAIEFRVLGPLEVSRGGRSLSIGAGKPGALLALLVVNANEVVSTDRLIDGLWAENPPKSAKQLQGYVSHLRRALVDGPVMRARPAKGAC